MSLVQKKEGHFYLMVLSNTAFLSKTCIYQTGCSWAK